MVPAAVLVFTFHNVSINSINPKEILISNTHLHSIMYLLIRIQPRSKRILPRVFTFHNVSINSRSPTTIISSIVFLLFLSTSFYSPHLTSIFFIIILLSAHIYRIVDLPIFLHYYRSTIYIFFIYVKISSITILYHPPRLYLHYITFLFILQH